VSETRCKEEAISTFIYNPPQIRQAFDLIVRGSLWPTRVLNFCPQ
jgi:hypothetical protein